MTTPIYSLASDRDIRTPDGRRLHLYEAGDLAPGARRVTGIHAARDEWADRVPAGRSRSVARVARVSPRRILPR